MLGAEPAAHTPGRDVFLYALRERVSVEDPLECVARVYLSML